MTIHTTHATFAPPPAAQTDACLIHIYPTGSLLGRRYRLGGEETTIGRGDECTICIPDASVSRAHALVETVGDGHAVTDLGSTNGTFVNDKRLTGPFALRDGDSLRIGKCLYRYLAGGNIEANYHEEIYRMTILDGLTQVHNRRYLNEVLDLELARANRHKRPVSLLLLDIDRFKVLNDTYGHLCGDAVLREVANRLRSTVRKGDLLARYGGEEFALLLVEAPPEAAVEAAERIRALVANEPFAHEQVRHDVTVSVGVAWTAGAEGTTPAVLVDAADRRLYRAKRAGRNRVCADDRDASSGPITLGGQETNA